MPSVGDVVVRFLGDTSQLDQSFTSVQERTKSASAAAAASTVELKAAQTELRTSLAAVKAEGGATAENMVRLAEAEKAAALAAAEAKEAHAALNAQLGIASKEHGYLAEAVSDATSKVAGMLGAMALAEGLKEWVAHVAEGVHELGKLQDKTGINITTLSGLEVMAKSAGVSLEQMGKSLVFLGINQVKAIEHAGKQRDAFAHLGISVEQLKHMNLEQLFFKVAEAMAHSTTKQEALNAARDLFNRGGMEMMPMLEKYKGHIEEMADKFGKLTGVTEDSKKAAEKYTEVMAEWDMNMKSMAVVAMPVVVSALKYISTAASAVALAFKDVGATIAYSVGTSILALWRFAGVMEDVTTLHFKEAATHAKSAIGEIEGKVNRLGEIYKENSKTFQDSYLRMWSEEAPNAIKETEGSLDHLTEVNKHATRDMAAEAKSGLEKTIAAIEQERAKWKEMVAAKPLLYKEAIDADIALVNKERQAQDDYYDHLIALYKKAGDAAKVKETQDAKATAQSKSATQTLTATAAATHGLEEETKKLGQTTAKVWEGILGKQNEELTQVQLMEKNWDSFIPRQVKDVIKLNHALEDAGIKGFGKLNQQLDATKKAEHQLNQMGIHEGKVWLQVQQAKLKAIIAVEHAAGHSAKAEEKQLRDIEHELRKFGGVEKDTLKTHEEMMDGMRKSVGMFAIDMGDAWAAVVQGTMSASDAILQSVGKLIGSIAKQWAEYFMAMAIADMFWNPARAAAELAAAAALEMAGALASSLGGGGGKSSGGSGGAEHQGPPTGPNPVSSPTGTIGGQNATHMAAGGLVTMPTLVMAGDARMAGAGSNTEAIIPLDNPRAMDAIAGALAARMGGSGVTINVGGMISPHTLNRTMKQVTAGVKSGNVRLTSGVSLRNTRRG